ncbi:MAG: hypothetical protein COA44_09950 [Arcobacter sp.]|nr:MAG: hypothetical protein COA44_09950 [Arcobacter sp.]
MNDIPLHDIKPLVEVPDNSLMILIIISAVILSLIFVSLGIWLYSQYKKTKEINLKKVYLKKIHEVDVSNAKQAAYEISEYARYIVKTDKEKALLDSLDGRLAQYKYKKSVEALDKETLGHFYVFLEVLDAG